MLGFSINGQVLNLRPADYVDQGEDGCSTSFMTLDVPPPKGPLFIFGDPFLRRFVTIYDMDGPKVGFAVAKHADVGADDVSRLISTSKGAAAPAPVAADTSSPAPLDAKDAPESSDDEHAANSVSSDDAANEIAHMLNGDDSSGEDAAVKSMEEVFSSPKQADTGFLQRHIQKQPLVSIQLHRASKPFHQ